MSQFVKTSVTVIKGYDTQTCDARELHQFLEVGRDFSNWIKGRITEYGFEQGVDYVFTNSPNPAIRSDGMPSKPRIEYTITIDMAKELAMVERTEKGRQVRRYFIECERKLRSVADLLSLRMSTGLTASQRGKVSMLINKVVAPLRDQRTAKRAVRKMIYGKFGVHIQDIPADKFDEVENYVTSIALDVRQFDREQRAAEVNFWTCRTVGLPAPATRALLR